MDGMVDLNSIYDDFFGKNSSLLTKTEEIKADDFNFDDIIKEIDELYLDNESKDVIKKIVNYIKNYNEKIEKMYINFNIIINSDNGEATDKIINIISSVAKKYDYVKGNNIEYRSFYKIEKVEDINDLYKSSNGIIALKDLTAIRMNDSNLNKKIMFTLKENLLNEKITFLTGKKEEVSEFLINDSALDEKYFIYRLNVIDPDVNDVYQESLDKISNVEVDDKFKIDLLDYITQTFNKREMDYITYRDNLTSYISFNKEIPKLELSKSTDEIFKDLNELVGLEKVKKCLYDLVDLINLKKKTKDDLKISDINLHMVFLGNPGTGKTTVARMVSNILYNLKYISKNKLIEVSSKDLVAEYVGQTAPKTMDVVNNAMGGVLFIDEAYALADKTGDNSYNQEAIATLIKAMEDYRDNLVVIFAGYTKEMQAFLDSNSGIVSRIGYTLEFDDYTNEELKEIFINMVKKAGFTIEDEALVVLDDIITENRNTKNFGNARFVRNVFEKTVLKHASNTKNIKKKEILKKITKKDITL